MKRICLLKIARAACVWTALFSQCHALSDDTPNSSSTILPYDARRLRDQQVTASPGLERGRRARELFDAASPETLQLLLFDENDGIAICAAWQRLRIQMEARFAGSDASAVIIHIPQELTREFIGFIEGRLHIAPPDGWRRIIRRARFTRDGRESFPVLLRAAEAIAVHESNENPDVTSLVRKYEQGRVTAPHVEIDSEATPPALMFFGGSAIEGEELVVTFPKEVKELIDGRETSEIMSMISGIAIHDRAVVVVDGPAGPDGGMVFCIRENDRKDVEVAWQKPTDAYWNPIFNGSEWFTELRVHNGKVYLFHGTHDSIGIEAFQIDTGKRLFSFNSHFPQK